MKLLNSEFRPAMPFQKLTQSKRFPGNEDILPDGLKKELYILENDDDERLILSQARLDLLIEWQRVSDEH